MALSFLILILISKLSSLLSIKDVTLALAETHSKLNSFCLTSLERVLELLCSNLHFSLFKSVAIINASFDFCIFCLCLQLNTQKRNVIVIKKFKKR